MPLLAASLRSEISQGDVFDQIPIVWFRSQDNVVLARFSKAILITHDCDFDKPNSRTCLLAEIRPLEEIDDGSKGNIRSNRAVNTLYMGQIGPAEQEWFVDFRRITRVDKELLQSRNREGLRLVSLTDEGRLALYRVIATFFSRDQKRRNVVPATPNETAELNRPTEGP